MHARLPLLPLVAFAAVAAVALGARPLHAAADAEHHKVKPARVHEAHLRVLDDDDESAVAALTRVEHLAPSPQHPAVAVPPPTSSSPPPPVVGSGAGLVAPAVLPAIAGSRLPLSLSIGTALALVVSAALAVVALRRARRIG